MIDKNSLPDLKELSEIFHDSQDTPAVFEGYAVFTSDSWNGVGTFSFCDDLNVWKELYPAILFGDALNQVDYEIYDEHDLLKHIQIYNDFEHSKWSEKDFDAFERRKNNLLPSFEINYVGPVKLLFDIVNSFADELIESFGKSPIDNKQKYLDFLNNYSRF